MKCFICYEPAAKIESDGDYEESACPKCGHYRVTGTALALMKTHEWRFDVELARKWVVERQSFGAMPVIDSHQAALLIDV